MGALWSFIWPIAITFGAVFSGVLFGQMLAIQRDRAKRREEENEQRNRTKESIANELNNVLEDARLYLAKYAQPHPGNFFYLSPFMNAMNATIGSGTFALIEPDLQEQISYVYGLVSQCMDQMRRIRDFDAGFALTLPDHRMNPIMEEMEKRLATIVSELPDRLPELIIRLTEPSNQTTEEPDNDSDPSGG